MKIMLIMILTITSMNIFQQSENSDKKKYQDIVKDDLPECNEMYKLEEYGMTAECVEEIVNKYNDVEDIIYLKLYLASLYELAKDYNNCVNWYKIVIEQEPEIDEIGKYYQNIAYCYMENGEIDKQIETYQEAIKRNEILNGDIYAALANVYRRIGEYSKARYYYEQYFDYPEAEEKDSAIFLIAETYEYEHDYKNALLNYRRLSTDFKIADIDYYEKAGEKANKMQVKVYENRKPDELAIFVNDKLIITEVDPVMKSDRVLVPLRGVFEELGAVVTWVHEEKRVFAEKEDIKVDLKIGTRKPTVNGVEVEIDVPAMLIKNHTFIPLRFVSESLGASVRWEEETQTVYINTKNSTNDEN